MKLGGANSSGQTPKRPAEHKHGYFSSKGVSVPLERSGETRRDQDRGRIRDAFMVFKGIDRPTFESKHSHGAGYKEWRAYAAECGLNLPA